MKKRKVKCKFEQIDKTLTQLVEELNSQLQDEHMFYDVEFDEESFRLDQESTEEDKKLFIEMLLSDALSTCMQKSMGDVDLDPWSRIKSFMTLRQSKEEVQSPLAPSEYEEIKVTAEKAKALDLESVYVNNQRPDWTQEQQEELIARKERDESAKVVAE